MFVYSGVIKIKTVLLLSPFSLARLLKISKKGSLSGTVLLPDNILRTPSVQLRFIGFFSLLRSVRLKPHIASFKAENTAARSVKKP